MNKSDKSTISITIFGKAYQIKCDPSEIQDIHAAALYFDGKIHECSEKIQASRSEATVMAGLNTTYELLRERKHSENRINMMHRRIQALQNELEADTAKQTEIDL